MRVTSVMMGEYIPSEQGLPQAWFERERETANGCWQIREIDATAASSAVDKWRGVAKLATFRRLVKKRHRGKLLPVGKVFTICQHFSEWLDKSHVPQQLATSGGERFALTRSTSWL